MATYTKNSNSYQGRYYKITLTQTTYDSENGIVNFDWKFEVLGGSSNYYSAPATYIDVKNMYDNTTQRVYSHSQKMYPSSTSFPVAKGSKSGTISFNTNEEGNLTLEVHFHKNSMTYGSNTWTTFDSTETFNIDQIPRQSVRIRINNEWKRATPYVRINNEWKRATAYVRINNEWKRGN